MELDVWDKGTIRGGTGECHTKLLVRQTKVSGRKTLGTFCK